MAPHLRTRNDGTTGRLAARVHPDVVLPAVAIVVSELALFAGRTDLALWGHFFTLLGCAAGLLVTSREGTTLTALAFLPLFRLVNLGMPLFSGEALYWLPLVYGAFLPSLYLVFRTHESPTVDFDPGRTLRLLVPAVVCGALLAGVRSALVVGRPGIVAASLRRVALLSVVTFGFVALVEEVLFRGVLQRELRARLGGPAGVGLTAVLFGVMYGTSRTGSIPFGIGLGVVLGVAYDRTDSLVTTWVIRGTFNAVLFGVLPLSGVTIG